MEKYENKKRNIDFWTLAVILILLGIGTMMVFSSSTASSYNSDGGDAYSLIFKHLMMLGLGLIAMVIGTNISMNFVRRYAYVLYIGTLLLLFLTMFNLPFTLEINGARRWIDIKITTFQPSEILKIALIIVIARFFADPPKTFSRFTKYKYDTKIFFATILILLPALFVLWRQPHVSCIIIVLLISVIMFIVGKIRKRFLIIAGSAGAGLLVIAFFVFSHISERVLVFLNPFASDADEAYQIRQSLIAIGSGGLFGKGLGQSIQKYLYLPEPYNDFIFAIFAEEFGFVGVILVMLLFMILIVRGYRIAIGTKNTFNRMVAVGITSMVAIQVVLNIAVVTSSMPVTGISLPLFSYGGTALIFTLFDMGLLLNISKESNITDKF